MKGLGFDSHLCVRVSFRNNNNYNKKYNICVKQNIRTGWSDIISYLQIYYWISNPKSLINQA